MRRAIAPSVALLLLASVEAFAGGTTAPPRHRPAGSSPWRLRPGAVAIALRDSRIDLEAVSARELMASVGGSAGEATGIVVKGTPPGDVASAVRIQRRLEGVWTLQVPAAPGSGIAEGDIDVEAEVVASSGRPNRLTPQIVGEPEIEVTVVPTPPRLVSRHEGGSTYEGGVLLELDLSKVRTSGTYTGTLVVTVNHF